MQVIAIQPGVFVAVIALEACARCSPVSVQVRSHDLDKPIDLWDIHGAQEQSVWEAYTRQAMQALAYFWHRTSCLDVVYAGVLATCVCNELLAFCCDHRRLTQAAVTRYTSAHFHNLHLTMNGLIQDFAVKYIQLPFTHFYSVVEAIEVV